MQYAKQTTLFFAIISMALIFCATALAGTYVYEPEDKSKSVQSPPAQKPSSSQPPQANPDAPAPREPGPKANQNSAGKPYKHTEKKGKKGPNK